MAAAEKALWFIESHYSEDLSLGRIAEVAGVSPFHLARLFPAMTGCSVVRYLRGRRMTEAARRLAGGAPDILEVAMASGYGSHEAFTRAFGEQFGLSPASVRERGSVAGLALVEPWRTADGVHVTLNEPRLAHDDTRLIAGLGCRYTSDTTQGIPAQWQRLSLHFAGALPKRHTAFGVCCNSDDEGNFEYIAGVDVPGFGGLDPALSTLRLPAREYVVATHHGHISDIRRTWQTFVNDWLPRSGLQVADAPDFEKYGIDFDDITGSGDVEIWLPLQS
ncbi:AraC family transcriptional regulator [Rhodanobacter sp. DHG33]|uniref:AraC family transcriptional regulator n=1 Tax=Rhodanobacter sp. DHG33 TaxID=2775921 RepID=UPI0017851F66|nr:AraC family transcriptional regulator [Rhodanobacter sp. DHG33]MBD8900167.1 AraC family transcriptional regulator [Rhodanobacter sp. DHG33]